MMFLKILFVIIFLFVMAFFICAAQLSGEISRREEEMYRDEEEDIEEEYPMFRMRRYN